MGDVAREPRLARGLGLEKLAAVATGGFPFLPNRPLKLCAHRRKAGVVPRFAASFFPRPTKEGVRKKSLAETNPKLAAQIHPGSDIKATEVTAGSHKKPLWVCKRGHIWKATVASRSQGCGCPYCSGRKAIVGETDLATVNPGLKTMTRK